MKTRIYEVEDGEGARPPVRLIEAASAAQAVRFVAKRHGVNVASAMRVAELMGTGVKVEKASEPE